MYVQAWTWGNPNELYHHGIMGQRWGKRNGPPYPLDPEDHSAREKRLKPTNAEQLASWKEKKTAKVNKKYGKKVARIEKKISKTTKASKLENLKIQKAQAIFKQGLKNNKILGTTEKQFVVKKRIKKALAITGGIAVAAIALYAANKVGYNLALRRNDELLSKYYETKGRVHNLHRNLVEIDGLSDDWRKWIINELNYGVGEEHRINYDALKKSRSMLDIYENANLIERLIAQVKGF